MLVCMVINLENSDKHCIANIKDKKTLTHFYKPKSSRLFEFTEGFEYKEVLFYLILCVPVITVLLCECQILAVWHCGWWVLWRVRCWLRLERQNFFGDRRLRHVVQPPDHFLLIWEASESWERKSDQHQKKHIHHKAIFFDISTPPSTKIHWKIY